MRFWSRVGRWVRRTVERFTEPSTRAPREPREPREPDYEPGPRGDDYGAGDRESRLPNGWVLVGLYHEGEKTQRIHATNATDVTDSEIAHADAIIVQFTDGGDDGYKWIHGASGWDSISDQIVRTVIPTSPKGTGEE